MKHFKFDTQDENLYKVPVDRLKDNKYLYFKRILDVLIIFIFLPLAIPLLLIGMLLIKLFSDGPIFFIQKRVGMYNKPFFIYKLRTMVHQADSINLDHTVEDDVRIFRIGKILRITKVDELPQFFNILKGDMSLIGPRPERLDLVNKLSVEIPTYNLRHLIKPGLSGLAQINNPKATPNESVEKLEYDLYYVCNLDFLLDLKIIWKTIFIVLRLNSL